MKLLLCLLCCVQHAHSFRVGVKNNSTLTHAGPGDKLLSPYRYCVTCADGRTIYILREWSWGDVAADVPTIVNNGLKGLSVVFPPAAAVAVVTEITKWISEGVKIYKSLKALKNWLYDEIPDDTTYVTFIINDGAPKYRKDDGRRLQGGSKAAWKVFTVSDSATMTEGGDPLLILKKHYQRVYMREVGCRSWTGWTACKLRWPSDAPTSTLPTVMMELIREHPALCKEKGGVPRPDVNPVIFGSGMAALHDERGYCLRGTAFREAQAWR
eukprot:TRINITY_DN126190_c0_g1_i1.p1 TRINITY_DN126190_c0_g1~~TRINITY_DN126190_c0_g1_i1.p1  ORF type:complete len:285 (-),score=16.21 TRINITY_DN126190_c0_g1_i1:33-839(-)